MSATDHGRAATYQRWGCRCDECREAAAEAQRRYRSTPSGRSRSRTLDREYTEARLILARRHHLEYQEILAALRAGEVVE